MKLGDYRNLLDQIDDQILVLLQERATIVKRVGELKSHTGVERIYAPHREREILSRLETQNRGQFPSDALHTIYTEIISACRALERPLSIAFLGPAGSFGHTAGSHFFGTVSRVYRSDTPTRYFYCGRIGSNGLRCCRDRKLHTWNGP